MCDNEQFRIALLDGVALQSWHTTSSERFSEDLYNLLQCTEYDYMVISTEHMLYVPVRDGRDNRHLRVLTTNNAKNGASVDATNNDIVRLPEILRVDAEKRTEFLAAFGGPVFYA